MEGKKTNFELLVDAIDNTKSDAFKALTMDNIAAGVRVRKSMQEIKKLAFLVRKDLQEIKHRVKKA